MARPWIINNAAEASGEIIIRGPIGGWMLEAGTIADQLAVLADATKITVRINSLGGDVDHAIEVFNLLRDHPARITVRVDAIAASAASVIAMAGDEIVMPANSLMMLHNPWTFAEGNADELRAQADVLDKYRDRLIETYVARTGKTAEDVQAMLDAETWMTAREAVAMGFADRVEEIGRANTQAYAAALDIPADVLARLDAETAPEPVAEPVETPTVAEPPPEPESAPVADHAPVSDPAEIVAMCVTTGLVDLAEGFIRNQAPLALVQARIQHAAAVRDLCALAKVPERAGEFIAAQTPEAQVRAALLESMAAADAATVNNQIPPDATPLSAAELAARAAEYVAEQSRKGITVSYARAVRHIQQGA